MDQYLAGEIGPAEIDAIVEEWHTGTSPLPLSVYLGMTPEEYALWVVRADALPQIRAERQVKA